MEKEQLTRLVEQYIGPMCEGGIDLPWEAIENITLLRDIVRERIESDKTLQWKLTDGHGELYDIQLHWEVNRPGAWPKVSVLYKIAPACREVSPEVFEIIAEEWNESHTCFFSMDADLVDPTPEKIKGLVKFHNIECTPVEIVYCNGHILVRFLRDIHGKEDRRNRETYNRLYQEAFFGSNGILSQMLREEPK